MSSGRRTGQEGTPVRSGWIESARRPADCCTLAVLEPLLSAILWAFVLRARCGFFFFPSSSSHGTTNALFRLNQLSLLRRHQLRKALYTLADSLNRPRRRPTCCSAYPCRRSRARTFSPPTRSPRLTPQPRPLCRRERHLKPTFALSVAHRRRVGVLRAGMLVS